MLGPESGVCSSKASNTGTIDAIRDDPSWGNNQTTEIGQKFTGGSNKTRPSARVISVVDISKAREFVGR